MACFTDALVERTPEFNSLFSPTKYTRQALRTQNHAVDTIIVMIVIARPFMNSAFDFGNPSKSQGSETVFVRSFAAGFAESF